MNNTFDIKRFGLVMGKDFQENWKRYGLQFLAMFGIIAIVLILASDSLYEIASRGHFMNEDRGLLAWASFMFLGFGLVFASTMMEPMRDKTKRTAFLMNPSSNLEKYFSRWLIVTVGYIITFFVALWLADLLRVAIFSVRYPKVDVHLLDFSKLISPESSSYSYEYVFPNKYFFEICVGMFFLFQSICVLGSTFWEKVSFVKTFAASVVIVLSFFLLARWTISIFYSEFYQFTNVLDSIFGRNEISKNYMMTITGVFALFTLVNWTIAFFRFRESEIINRW